MRFNPFRRRRVVDFGNLVDLVAYEPFLPEPEQPQQSGNGRKFVGRGPIVREFLGALGIDPSTTRAVTLRIAVDEAVSVEVEQFVLDTHLRTLTEVVQRRQVVAPPPLPLDPYQVMAEALL